MLQEACFILIIKSNLFFIFAGNFKEILAQYLNIGILVDSKKCHSICTLHYKSQFIIEHFKADMTIQTYVWNL